MSGIFGESTELFSEYTILPETVVEVFSFLGLRFAIGFASGLMPDFCAVFLNLSGNAIVMDEYTRNTPERIIRVVLEAVGNPKNGMRVINNPRKNVDLRCIMITYYTSCSCFGKILPKYDIEKNPN